MDPVIASIATGVLAALTPYLKLGAETILKGVGEAGVHKVEDLLKTLRARFAGDPVGQPALAAYEKDPEGEGPVMESVLKRKLEQNPALAAELRRWLGDLGPTLQVIQNLHNAENVTGIKAGSMTAGAANVQQTITGHAKDVTGIDVDSIG